jgi:hypothetical protein
VSPGPEDPPLPIPRAGPLVAPWRVLWARPDGRHGIREKCRDGATPMARSRPRNSGRPIPEDRRPARPPTAWARSGRWPPSPLPRPASSEVLLHRGGGATPRLPLRIREPSLGESQLRKQELEPRSPFETSTYSARGSDWGSWRRRGVDEGSRGRQPRRRPTRWAPGGQGHGGSHWRPPPPGTNASPHATRGSGRNGNLPRRRNSRTRCIRRSNSTPRVRLPRARV